MDSPQKIRTCEYAGCYNDLSKQRYDSHIEVETSLETSLLCLSSSQKRPYKNTYFVSLISHFPIENRKASMDCLEEQHKVAENYKS